MITITNYISTNEYFTFSWFASYLTMPSKCIYSGYQTYFLFNVSIVFYCWYCLVIKYLRVITSSRLCGDNPANFALLHTIAYNCQSSSFNDVLVPGCSLFSELFRSRGPFVLPFIGSSVCPPARISSPPSVASSLVTSVTLVTPPSPLLLLLLFLITSRGWTLANDHPSPPSP